MIIWTAACLPAAPAALGFGVQCGAGKPVSLTTVRGHLCPVQSAAVANKPSVQPACEPLTSPLLPSSAPLGGGGEAPRPVVAPLSPGVVLWPQPSPFWLPPGAGCEALLLAGPSAGFIHCAAAAMVGESTYKRMLDCWAPREGGAA